MKLPSMHSIGECDSFAYLKREIWTKPYLRPANMEHLIVG